MRAYVRTVDGDEGLVDVDPGQSISDQIGSDWAIYAYNLRRPRPPRLILIGLWVLLAILGIALAITTAGNF